MNILILCHHYNKHEMLTLVNGKTEEDYIPLTPENIHNIYELTKGKIAKLSFVDPNPELYRNEEDSNVGIIQYREADELPDESFDAIYTIHCSPFMDLMGEYGSKLKERSSKIIDIKPEYSKTPNKYTYVDASFPLFVKPLSLGHEKNFGETIHKLIVYDKINPKSKETTYVYVNRHFLPKLDEFGKGNKNKKGTKKKRNRKRAKTNKRRNKR